MVLADTPDALAASPMFMAGSFDGRRWHLISLPFE